MKASDIVNQLSAILPKFSDKFTSNFSVTGLSRVGTTVTAITAAAHGLSIGKAVNIIGAQTPISIGSLTRALTTGTMITDTDHDITAGVNTDVEIVGATEAEFNGTFTIIAVKNRRTITFSMPDSGAVTATGAPLLLNGSSFLESYNGLFEVTAVPSTTSFEYEVTNATLFTPPTGTIIARTNPRISASISSDRVVDAYTKQSSGDLWAFVILDDVSASKSRNIDTDAVDNLQRGNEFRQQIVQPFSILIVIPTTQEITARDARDLSEDLFRPICQSILFSKIDSGLFVGAQNPIQFVDHGFVAYNTAFYAHTYNFQMTSDITFDDTIGYSEDVAFRDIALGMNIDFGTQEDPLTVTINLDDEALP